VAANGKSDLIDILLEDHFGDLLGEPVFEVVEEGGGRDGESADLWRVCGLVGKGLQLIELESGEEKDGDHTLDVTEDLVTESEVFFLCGVIGRVGTTRLKVTTILKLKLLSSFLNLGAQLVNC
jgi:hypothetical protein